MNMVFGTVGKLKQELEKTKEKYAALLEKEAELCYQYEKLQKETEDMQRQDAELKALHQNVRQLKHDMKNHLMVLTAYLNDGETELRFGEGTACTGTAHL